VRAEEDTVAVTIENRIAWVRFNRPEKRNCMSPKLNRQMLKVIEELEFREDVGVLVLSGEGDAWSAGMDLRNTSAKPKRRASGRSASRSAKPIAGGTACAGMKSHHRHGQWLVLWRRLWPALCVRYRRRFG
jgi:enoyl-CoA hydratase/carnithine racemase